MKEGSCRKREEGSAKTGRRRRNEGAIWRWRRRRKVGERRMESELR